MNIHDRDEIKRLEARLAALTAALERVIRQYDADEDQGEAIHAARAALDAAGGA